MRNNAAPFSDVCELVTVTSSKDSNGYAETTEQKTEVFCSVIYSAVRSEFYEAMKAGMRISATFEVWEDDYDRQTLVNYANSRYKVERAYPTGHGTLELVCTEGVR